MGTVVAPPAGITIREAATDADWDGMARLESQAFTEPLDEAHDYVRRHRDHAVIRVAVDGSVVVAGVVILPAGQWYGGRSVPAGAIGSVCVLPEARGSGLATAMLSDLVSTSRERGLATAPLWPSTTRLYRGCGWETVERTRRLIVETRSLAELRPASGRPVRAPAAADVDAMIDALAPDWNGAMHRPWWWRASHRIQSGARPEHHVEYGWEEDGRLTGMVHLRTKDPAPPRQQLAVSEWWTRTADATRGLGHLLGTHSAQGRHCTFAPWALPPHDDLFRLLPDSAQVVEEEGWMPWMQRIVDPVAALSRRGWSTSVSGRLELELTDRFDAEPRRLVLEVARGSAHVSEGGSGAVRLGIGALSTWYAGGLGGRDGARQGLVMGGDADLELMSALVNDRGAWLSDFF